MVDTSTTSPRCSGVESLFVIALVEIAREQHARRCTLLLVIVVTCIELISVVVDGACVGVHLRVIFLHAFSALWCSYVDYDHR